MSEFIRSLLNNALFLSILAQGNFEVLNHSQNEDLIKYSDTGFVIRNIILLDSILFEQVSMGITPKGMFFSFITKDSLILENADCYFGSLNNTKQGLDAKYKSHGYTRRKFSDSIDGYDIHITVRRSQIDSILVSLLVFSRDEK